MLFPYDFHSIFAGLAKIFIGVKISIMVFNQSVLI